jgi:hypothetical protein
MDPRHKSAGNNQLYKETEAFLGRHGIDIVTGEKFEVGKGSLAECVDSQRTKFKELAREAALECYVKYSYLPANKAAAENWHPHVWVTDAMKKACASESEHAHIAEMRADTAEAERDTLRMNLAEARLLLREIRQDCSLSRLRDGQIDNFLHKSSLVTENPNAAEQRIAELTEILLDTKSILSSELSYELYHKIAAHVNRIDAALNPKPEAGSHE